MFTKDCAAGIVEEGLQPGNLGLGAPGPDNVAVVKERANVQFKEEKKKSSPCQPAGTLHPPGFSAPSRPSSAPWSGCPLVVWHASGSHRPFPVDPLHPLHSAVSLPPPLQLMCPLEEAWLGLVCSSVPASVCPPVVWRATDPWGRSS